MAREQDYDWVNVWASASGVTTDAVTSETAATPEPAAAAVPAPEPAAVVAAPDEPAVEIIAPPERALAPRIARFVASKAVAAAAAGGAAAPAKPEVQASPARIAVPRPAISEPLPDQLMRDIAEIERVRDALAAGPVGRHMRTFMLVPSRSGGDVAPLLIGGVLALVMLTVFGAAAAVTKFGR